MLIVVMPVSSRTYRSLFAHNNDFLAKRKFYSKIVSLSDTFFD